MLSTALSRTRMSPAIATERVRNGAAVLDQVKPHWREQIDLDQLDLASSHHCILGQLYDNYHQGLHSLLPDVDFCTRLVWSESHGFNGTGSMDYAALQEAWRAEIERAA